VNPTPQAIARQTLLSEPCVFCNTTGIAKRTMIGNKVHAAGCPIMSAFPDSVISDGALDTVIGSLMDRWRRGESPLPEGTTFFGTPVRLNHIATDRGHLLGEMTLRQLLLTAAGIDNGIGTKFLEDFNQRINTCHLRTQAFWASILGHRIPDRPERLEPDRKKWALKLLMEELGEFKEAQTLEDEADAMVDLIYFAFGRLTEMGVAPFAAFDLVHEANMAKEPGEKDSRAGSGQPDAIKPDDWDEPDLSTLCSLTMEHIRDVQENADEPIASLTILDTMSPAIREAVELSFRKAQDYNDGDVTRDDYFPFGDISYLQMLWVKMMRLRSLHDKSEGANFESLRDTLLDMINYSAFWADAIQRRS